MAYPPKVVVALDVLSTTGIRRSSYAPPLYRLFWSVGVPVRPPHFNTFMGNVLIMGGWFGIFFTLTMWATSDHARSLLSLIMQCLITGLSFGLIMSVWTRGRARRANLPAWSELDVAHRFD
jgi:hypothetical protein